MQIGVIGLGAIATAVVEGIVDDGHDFRMSARSRDNASRLTARYGNVTVAANQAVVDGSEVVLIGLLESVAPEVLGALRFREDQQIVSLMACLSAAEVSALVAPATLTTRMIPFPAIAKGGSVILTCGDAALIASLFGARNQVFALDNEDELSAYLCAQAVLSPAVSLVGETAAWLSQHANDADKGETFLRTLVGSSLLGSPCEALLQTLDTPGGYNQRLRNHLHDAGMREQLREGLERLLG